MRKIKTPKPAMPFTGLLAPSLTTLQEIGVILKKQLGPVAIETEPYEWKYSSFYEREMGSSIWRKFVFFRRLIEPESLKELKLWSNGLEDEAGKFVDGEFRRSFNIDPGFIDQIKVVMASTKDPGHRIYLGDGIFVDLLLFYKKGSFRPFDHTYPDMKSPAAISMFNNARSTYIEIMKSGDAGGSTLEDHHGHDTTG